MLEYNKEDVIVKSPLDAALNTLWVNNDILKFNPNTFIFNLATILRSTLARLELKLNDGFSLQSLRTTHSEFINDIQTTINTTCQLIQNIHNQHIHYKIIFHQIDYLRYPDQYMRNKKDLILLYQLLKELLRLNNFKLSDTINTYFLETHSDNKNISFIFSSMLETINPIKQLINGFRDKVVFIDHIYLIYHYVRDFMVIDTFTGNVWNKNNVNEKIFNSKLITFNIYSHLLLGDRNLIKPLLKGQAKKDFFNDVNSSRRVWTEQMIKNWLKKNNHTAMLLLIDQFKKLLLL